MPNEEWVGWTVYYGMKRQQAELEQARRGNAG